MRTAFLIVSTLLLLATTGLGFLATNRGLKDAKDIDKIYQPAKAEIAAAAAHDAESRELMNLGEHTGRLKAGAVVFGLMAVLALGLLVVNFTGKDVVSMLALAVIGAALLATFISPQYDLGPMAPASARSLGYVITVLAVLGAGAAFVGYRRRRQPAM